MKVLKVCSIISAGILLGACNAAQVRDLKRADDLITLSYVDNQQNNQPLEIPAGADEFAIVNAVLSQKVFNYSEITTQLNKAKAGKTEEAKRRITREIMYGMLLKSDRVCKAYLDNLADLRNTAKLTYQSLQALPGIVAAFTGAPTSVILETSRIGAVANGVKSAFDNFDIEENTVKDEIIGIHTIRNKLRAAFIEVLKPEPPEMGDYAKQKDVYNIHTFMFDLEEYHQSCSLFDKIFYKEQVSDKLQRLVAYRLLNSDDRNTVQEM